MRQVWYGYLLCNCYYAGSYTWWWDRNPDNITAYVEDYLREDSCTMSDGDCYGSELRCYDEDIHVHDKVDDYYA